MTIRTSKRKAASSNVKAPARAVRKPKKSTRTEAVQPAKIPAGQAAKRMTEWVQGSFLTAALGPREDNTFEISCAQIVQRAVGAAAVVLTLQRKVSYQHFGTSEAARSLAADHSANDPLARCLSSGAEYQVAIGGKRKLTKLHDAAASSNGWSHYLCIPLYSPVGDIIGAASIYFAGSVNLRNKVAAFDKNVRTALALALAAHATAPAADIETHQFNSLAAAIPGVVYQRIVQPDGDIRYTYLSEGARELFGVDPEAVLKDPEVLFSTYTEDYKNTFRKRLIEASQSLTKWDVEASVNMPDGRRKTTHAVARPERRADNSVLWTGVILDASRAKEAEDSLKEANRLVGLANHAKSAFLAKMSHEMRTPLNGVLGMGDLLLKTELSQRQMRLASTLCDSAKGLLGIINDVLDLSRIEAGHFKLDLQDFNLRHCIEDAVELCATSGYRKGLEVNLIIAPDIPVGVKSDPVRIRQVLINLIGNAVKFTETGEVTIRLMPGTFADNRESVVFEVSDTGIGIDAAAISRLFEPFAQADASISRRFGGTGLGLSITRHLVELLGGTVSLSSERGHGTNVRFEIPFEVTAAAHPPILPHDVTLTGVRVLVVDDRATSREMLANNLANTGARVDVVDGEEVALDALARAALEGDPYRIAIIDRVKPRCSSLHLCRTIRSNPRLANTAMVVLMSTNWNGNPIDQKGLNDTVFLSKPARRADMMSAVVRAHRPDIAHFGSSTSTFASLQAERSAPPALKLRVLLVEDNATNIEVAREYLAELECRVTVAVNGIEAITTFDRAQFDIILMDTQMPELDGLSATRRIRETERARCLTRTPIIAVTANAYDSDRTQALEAGSDDFLSKPFTDMQLRSVLQKWSSKTDDKSSAATPQAVVVPLSSATLVAATDPAASKAISNQLTERLDETLHAVLLRSRPAFLSRLLRTFLSSMPETVMTLRAAIEQEDGELLRTLAHSLKSSSANVGAKRLAELCRLLDVKLKLGADAADCSSLTDAIETELGLVEDALEQVVAHLPGVYELAVG
jgi:two-component system, sensor histidine kinase and response regulator